MPDTDWSWPQGPESLHRRSGARFSRTSSRGDRRRDRFPPGNTDERELFLTWLRYLRGAVLRKIDGLHDEQARWRADDRLMHYALVGSRITTGISRSVLVS